MSNAVRTKDACLNAFIGKRRNIETPTSLNYAVVKCVQDNLKLRRQTGMAAGHTETKTKFSSIVV